MKEKMMIEINTERLTLRPLGTEYLESVHEYATDPENTKYMIHLPNESIEETRDFLLRAENEWMKEAPSFIEGGRRNRASDEDRMECLYELYVDLPEKERHGMKIEMHVHTSEGSPCAETDAESIVRAYSEAGYDAVVITNHFDSVLYGSADSL